VAVRTETAQLDGQSVYSKRLSDCKNNVRQKLPEAQKTSVLQNMPCMISFEDFINSYNLLGGDTHELH
jgi:hypothetical protein